MRRYIVVRAAWDDNDFAPEVKRILRRSGFALLHEGKGDHEIWTHPTSGLKVTVEGSIRSRHTATRS
jgi:hypothetical protein